MAGEQGPLQGTRDEDGHSIRLADEANQSRLEAAMRCAQSCQDMEGLDEQALYSRMSAFTGYRAPGPEHRLSSSGGHHYHLANGGETSSSTSVAVVAPFWYRGSMSSHCSRGCCVSPFQPALPVGRLLGPEYAEFPEDSSTTKYKPIVKNVSDSAAAEQAASGQGGSSSNSGLCSLIQEVVAKELFGNL